jgi:hypothetical protein
MGVVERFTGKSVTLEQATEIASKFAAGAYKDEAESLKNGVTPPALPVAALAGSEKGGSDGAGSK